MERPDSKQTKIPLAKSLEEQTRHGELDSILLFERLKHPTIRGQAIDLMLRNEETRKDEIITDVVFDKKGKAIRSKTGRFALKKHKYVPQTREQVEMEFDKDLEEIQLKTKVSFGGKGPNAETVSLNWKFPDAIQKPNIRQMAMIEAHEKGHGVRYYGGKYLDKYFAEAFDQNAVEFTRDDYYRDHVKEERGRLGYEDAKKQFFQYLFSARELAERMSQLKNYFGMRADEQFTKEHLNYARLHYIQDTGMDNRMRFFFQAVTPEKEEKFLEIINSAGI